MLVRKGHQPGTNIYSETGALLIGTDRIFHISIEHLALPEAQGELGLVEHGEAPGISNRDIVAEYCLGDDLLAEYMVVGYIQRSVAKIQRSLIEFEHTPLVLHSRTQTEVILEHIAEGGADFQPVTYGIDSLHDQKLIVVVMMDGIVARTSHHPGPLFQIVRVPREIVAAVITLGPRPRGEGRQRYQRRTSCGYSQTS